MSFGIGLSAIRASQLGLEVAGQNVANADTEGYSRQRLLLSSVGPNQKAAGPQVGQGVQVADVRREADTLLLERLRSEIGVQGQLDALASRLGEIESSFAEPGDAGLGAALTDFFGRASELSVDPGNTTLRNQATQAAGALALSFSSLSTRLDSIARNVRPEIASDVNSVNQLTRQIADLNRTITGATQRGNPANELVDRRETLLRELTQMLGVDVVRDPRTGGVSVLAEGNLLVSQDRARELELAPNDGGPTRLRVVGTSEPISPTSGQIAGLLTVESKTVPELIEGLDTLARTLAFEVNRLHSRGVGLDGSFSALESAHGVSDPDAPLADAGLPYPPEAGSLFFSVTNRTTGAVETREILIDPSTQSLRDVATELDSVGGVLASVDEAGHLRLRAVPGFGFDFADRVDPNPGSVGGATVSLAGRYTGEGNPTLTLRAAGSGTVGITDGLQMEVVDAGGTVVRTVDVGRGYSPNSPLEIARGVTAKFASGAMTAGDTLDVQLISDPDTGGLLPSIGLNALFTGGSAAELRVVDAVEADPSLLAVGFGGDKGDNGMLIDLIELRDASFGELDGAEIQEFYALLVGEVGGARRRADRQLESQDGLMQTLNARREEVSGVSIDEELVNLIRFQQSFQAAARYLSTIAEANQILMSI